MHQQIQRLEKHLQSVTEESSLIVIQKVQLLEDYQNLWQQMNLKEAEDLQNLEQEKQESQRRLHQQQQELNTFRQQMTWIIKRDEIKIKEKELGRGAYG